MQRTFYLTVVSFFLVTACEMETPPPAERPAQQNPVVPVAETAQITESTSTTTTSVDGNTRRTVTESSSVSVNAGGLLGAIAGASAPAAANTARDFSGQWRVSSADNRECRANLVQPGTPNANGTVQMQGCFGDLFGITRWTLRGSELVLSDAFGNKKISLRATGVNRLDGGGVTMWR